MKLISITGYKYSTSGVSMAAGAYFVRKEGAYYIFVPALQVGANQNPTFILDSSARETGIHEENIINVGGFEPHVLD